MRKWNEYWIIKRRLDLQRMFFQC